MDGLLLVEGVRMRTDAVDIGLLHLNLLVSGLLSHHVASSPFSHAEFAENKGQNCSSDDHSSFEHFVVSNSFFSSDLSLFFSQFFKILFF